MPEPNRAGPPRGELWRDATLTLAAVLLAFAACDDLTTGNATTFTVEWSALALCPSWLLFVSWRLLRGERRWLGLVSVIVLPAGVAAVVGQDSPSGEAPVPSR